MGPLKLRKNYFFPFFAHINSACIFIKQSFWVRASAWLNMWSFLSIRLSVCLFQLASEEVFLTILFSNIVTKCSRVFKRILPLPIPIPQKWRLPQKWRQPQKFALPSTFFAPLPSSGDTPVYSMDFILSFS